MFRPATKKRTALILSALASAVCTAPAMAQLRAFGEAEGFGTIATGGRGGTIYHVTNLNDSGTGSFRDAVSASNRIIVFDVGGVINLSSAVSAKSNLTIAGQTAPGGGISINGFEGASFDTQNNDIVRYVRFRPGDGSPGSDSGINLGRTGTAILDHVSVEFAKYDNIDAVATTPDRPIITIQNSIIADPISNGSSTTGQGFGAHIEAVNGFYTLSNNLWVSSHNRNPLAKVNEQFKNNIEYNNQAGYTTGGTSTPFDHDLVNNAFIYGPASGSDTDYFQLSSNDTFYATGNVQDSNTNGTLDGSISNPTTGTIVGTPNFAGTTSLPTLSVSDAYNFVTAHAGASNVRDQLDSQVVSQIQSLGSAGPSDLYQSAAEDGLTNGGLGTITTATRAVGFDADNDGVADSWEAIHGMSSSTASDALLLNPFGYRMIEQYINELGATNDTRTSVAGTSGAWSSTSNWAGGVVPGVYDYAQVRGTAAAGGSLNVASGTASAMELSIGGGGPASGENVTVSGGTLSVYDTITVGDQNNAALVLNSGTINAWGIQIGNTLSGTTYNGALVLNGGVLQTSMIMLGGGTPSNWTTGGSITFNAGTIAAGSTLTINAPISLAGAANFDTNGNAGTISGVISGAGTITKWDTGSLNLTGNNSSFTGGVVLKGGELGISADSNIGNSTSSITFSGGLLRINGTSLTSIDAHAVNWSTFNGGFNIASASNSFTVAQVISGSGSFTKDGPGVLSLTASNSYSGGTNLKGGVLAISNDSNIGGSTRALNFQGGELRILGTTITNFDAHSGNWSSFNGGIDVNTAANIVTINQSLGGNGALTKDGPGTLVLAASNSFTGTLTINAGVLRVGNANAISNVTLNLISGGGSLDLNGFSSAIGNITGSGGLDLKGQTFMAGSNNVASTYSGVISDSVGGGNFVKTGTATLTLSGTSTFASTLTIKGGEIDTATIASAGTNSPLGKGSSASSLVLDGGRLSYTGTGNPSTNRSFTLGAGGGTLDAGSGDTDWTNTANISMTGTGNRTLTLDGSATSSNVSWFLFGIGDPSSGVTSLTKTGSGRWWVGESTSAASLSYSGDTTVNSGTFLLYAKANVLPFGPGRGDFHLNGGTFDLRQNQGINGLYGAGTVSGVNNGTVRTLTIGNGDASGSFGGAITSTLAVTKTGTGVQVFSGVNTYVGGTTINGGVLQFNQASSIGGSGANVIVNSPGIAAAGYAMDQTFIGRVTTASTGAIALAANSSNALSVANYPNLELGGIGNVTYSGTLTPNVSTYRLGGGTGTLTLSNTNALTGARDVQIFAGGTIALTESNDYSGNTTINPGAIFRTGLSNILPFGAGKGNVVINAGTFNLGNNNININAQVGTGTVLQGGTNARSLTLGNGDATGTFSGVISGSASFSLVKNGLGLQALLGSNAWGGGTTVNAGTLLVNNSNNGPISITGGSLKLTEKAQNLDPSGTSVFPSIAVTSGKLDITNNAAIVDWTGASPIASIAQQIGAGAITSSLVDATHSIGFGEASSLGIGSFAGASVDSSAIVMRATVDGDANLDGTVNALDFTRLASSFGTSGYWSEGDFNGDGVVNALDFNVLASDFGATMSAPPVLEQLVPEPGTVAMLALWLLSPRRRSRRSKSPLPPGEG